MKRILMTIGLIAWLFPTAVNAEFTPRYLGSIVSDNEYIIDASDNGWILVGDSNNLSSCAFRTRLDDLGTVIKLCDKGMSKAVAVNRKGVVLGLDNNGAVAVWGDADGLKSFQNPSDGFTSLSPVEINNNGEVIGTSVKESWVDGYIISNYKAYRWTKQGQIKSINLPAKGDTLAKAINDKGEIVVVLKRELKQPALYLGRSSFTRIDRRGQAITPSIDDVYKINDRGQIAWSRGSIFTSTRGWRSVDGIEQCDRCDEGFSAEISSNGQALFENGYRLWLSDYPHKAVSLSCLAPNNRSVENTNILYGNYYSAGGQAKFLQGGKILFNADFYNDSKYNQIFVLEPRGKDSEVRDYCPNIQVTASSDERFNCVNSTSGQGCKGSFKVVSTDGALAGVEVKLYASQALYDDKGNLRCNPVLLNTFSSSTSGSKFSFITDPQFSYYLTLGDARYVPASTYVSDIVELSAPSGSCRDPL